MANVYRIDSAKVEQKSLTADTTLTYSDTGKTILLDAVGEAITLPAPLAGISYKFLVTADVITSAWVITATGAILEGGVTEAGIIQLCAGKTSINLVHTKASQGDVVTLESDGTNWYVNGQLSVAASFTTGA